MIHVLADFKGTKEFVSEEEIEKIEKRIFEAHDKIENRTGEGREMLGWLKLEDKISEQDISRIKTCADRIRKQADVFIVIGIGGSYLGARAVIDMLNNSFYNLQSSTDRKFPQIIFAGNNMSGKYLRNLVEYIQDKDVAINVISKSGTTLEPAMTFRILKMFLEEKYGKSGAAERIYVTTDKAKGVLKGIAMDKGYETFVVPDDVGGRYSVLTAVGLLPIAVSGIEIEDLLDGANFAKEVYKLRNVEKNDCYRYAAIRNILNENGKDIEIFATYEPSLHYFIEWAKQLFGESEGKENKGIFPVGVEYTTDLHSLGQIIQQGKRNIFETVIRVDKPRTFIKLPKSEIDFDGLNYLADREIDDINDKAFKGTFKAHVEGGVPNIVIDLEEFSAFAVGQLIMFFEKACAISAYTLGVNPFNQPGVESYKNNMMSLLRGDQ